MLHIKIGPRWCCSRLDCSPRMEKFVFEGVSNTTDNHGTRNFSNVKMKMKMVNLKNSPRITQMHFL